MDSNNQIETCLSRKSSEDKPQIFTPPAFEDFRGYLTLEDNTLMQWCVDQDFCGEAACAVRYDDPNLIWKGSE